MPREVNIGVVRMIVESQTIRRNNESQPPWIRTTIGDEVSIGLTDAAPVSNLGKRNWDHFHSGMKTKKIIPE